MLHSSETRMCECCDQFRVLKFYRYRKIRTSGNSRNTVYFEKTICSECDSVIKMSSSDKKITHPKDDYNGDENNGKRYLEWMEKQAGGDFYTGGSADYNTIHDC